VVESPTGRVPQKPAQGHGIFGWIWAKRGWIAAVTGIVFLLSTLYVLWAIKDLPDPS